MDKLNKRREIIEERIGDLEGRKREITGYEPRKGNKPKKEREQRLRDPWDSGPSAKSPDVTSQGRGHRDRAEEASGRTVAADFPKLPIGLQIQGDEPTASRKAPKKRVPRRILKPLGMKEERSSC